MAELQEKIQNVLDETRMLILGSEVMIGFASRSVLEPGFEELSPLGRASSAVSMGALAFSLGLFMTPIAYHRIVWGGEDKVKVHQCASTMLCWGLAPFAVAIGSGVYAVGERVHSVTAGLIISGAVIMLALGMWYGFPIACRKGRFAKEPVMSEEKPTQLSQKIKHVLTECRIVLPGAQALLGFASIAVLFDSFEKLPVVLKGVHVIGLCFIALAVVLLMTPAAYHRIVEKGEESETFHKVATRLLLTAMGALAIGMASAVWIVFDRVMASRAAGAIAGTIVAVGFLFMWFGWTWLKRRERSESLTSPVIRFSDRPTSSS